MNKKTNKIGDSKESHLEYDLYIIATPIGNMGDITLRALETLKAVDIILCEDTRTSGKLLSFYGISNKKLSYHEHNAISMSSRVISMIKEGKKIALISDAGMPLISDPGYRLVSECVKEDLKVTCLPGASASLTALAISGLPTNRFLFAGFIPQKQSARKKFLSELKDIPSTLIFYETSRRLLDSLIAIKDNIGDRNIAVARELTKKFEEVRRDTVSKIISYYKDSDRPKGEIVIILEGQDKNIKISFDNNELDEYLNIMIKDKNMSVKDVSALAAEKFGCKKHYAYNRAIELKKDI